MRKDITIVAAVVLAGGLSSIAAGVAVNPNFHGTGKDIFPASVYTTYQNGLYETRISSNLTLHQQNDMEFFINSTVVSFNGTEKYALVPLSELPAVNASNYRNFSVGTATNNSQNVDFTNVPPGSYAYVSPQHNLLAFGVTPEVALEEAGYLGVGGLVICVAGFALIIIGIFLRPRML